MKLVTPALRIAVIVLSFLTHLLAQSPGSAIESIDIQGNRRLTDEEIYRAITTRTGQSLDNERLKKDLKAILASGQFDPASTRVKTEAGPGGGAVVVFEVMELPLVAAIDFAGLKYVSRDEIDNYLSTEIPRLKAGTPYHVADAREARSSIRWFLQRRGFEDAVVTVAEKEVSATSLSIIFQIDEMRGDDDN